MSFLRRLFGRPSAPTAANAPTPPERSASRRINLVADDLPEPVPPPANIGIQGSPAALPWTVARLERIVRRANASPADSQFQLEARHARHCLSRFWLQAPIDQIEALYGGPIGQVQRLLLHGTLPSQPLAADEEAWQQTLSQALLRDFSVPERLNLLLALMPYCPRGELQVGNAAETLPSWLLGDYASCFDPSLATSWASRWACSTSPPQPHRQRLRPPQPRPPHPPPHRPPHPPPPPCRRSAPTAAARASPCSSKRRCARGWAV